MAWKSRGSLRLCLATLVGCGVLVAACGPEAARSQGGGLGADVGNASAPIQMHGNQSRNNPSFDVPEVGRAPKDARGVEGWWALR